MRADTIHRNDAGRTAGIVGGGIAGMAVAAALARKGWRVRVRERASEPAETGAGLQLGPNAARALEGLGLLSAVSERAVRPQAAVMRDGLTGFEILRIPLADAAEKRWGAPYLHIHRADLLDCLAAGARDLGVALETGAEVAPEDFFQDGENTLAIVAAGARSAFCGRKPVYTGNAAWRALVETSRLPENLIAPDATVWVGPGRHLVAYPLRGGRLVNVVAVAERDEWPEEGWSRPGDSEALRAAFAGWHPVVETLLAGVDRCTLWGLFERPAALVSNRENAVQVGDAAHAMPPFTAQGAAMALEDAATLAQCLEGREVPAALARYAALRRGRIERVCGAGRRNARLFHMRGPLKRMLTYGPMALASRLTPGLVASRLDWLYGFDATEETP